MAPAADHCAGRPGRRYGRRRLGARPGPGPGPLDALRAPGRQALHQTGNHRRHRFPHAAHLGPAHPGRRRPGTHQHRRQNRCPHADRHGPAHPGRRRTGTHSRRPRLAGHSRVTHRSSPRRGARHQARQSEGSARDDHCRWTSEVLLDGDDQGAEPRSPPVKGKDRCARTTGDSRTTWSRPQPRDPPHHGVRATESTAPALTANPTEAWHPMHTHGALCGWAFLAAQQQERAHRSTVSPFLNVCPAASYSPTPSPVQYHRR